MARVMDEPGSQSAWLNDPRLAAHALSPTAAWLWRALAPRILWTNPVGAAIFDTDTPATAAQIEFEPQHPAVRQIARLATSLPAGGTPRLERLRGFGAALGGTSICLCSRIALADGSAAVLLIATERTGKELPLPERVRRLLADLDRPSAVFSADGELIEAHPSLLTRFGPARDLIALGASDLAHAASAAGSAEGRIAPGTATLRKLGAGPTFALLAEFSDLQPESVKSTEPETSISPRVPNPAAAEARRRSFRFVWQMDAALRFTLGTAEFARLLGAQTGAALERPWQDVSAALGVDRDGRIARALTARETWSGIVVDWPVDGTSERLPIEMSGLPVFDRDRQFAGYRGFGICRDLDRLTELQRKREEASAQPITAEPDQAESEELLDNVLPFPLPPPPEPAPLASAQTQSSPGTTGPEQPSLSAGEHSAFQELARELTERLKHPPQHAPEPPPEPPAAAAMPSRPRSTHNGNAARDTQEGRPILERLPIGILVYRLNTLLYANRAFLNWTGYPNLDALSEAGGLDSLFIETNDAPARGNGGNGAKTLTITTVNGNQKPVEGRLFSVAWNEENALVLMIDTQAKSEGSAPARDDAALRRLEAEKNELKTILDTATDGVLVLDRAGRLLSGNKSAEALFGYASEELLELSLGELFVPESRRPVLDALERLARAQGARMLDAGREAIGRVRQGGLVPLYITMGRIEDGDKFCAVLRDITAWKRNEEELINARQEAEKASTAKSEFLAKISHEIRTPLNAIIGFSEVMIDERFGPIGNDRYRQYLQDIHTSGEHLIALLNDLLDLSKIEAGKLDLTFVTVNLNDIVQQCVASLQPEANRQRVIVRTALNPHLPPIVADARSVRQIALNILSHSVKHSGAGGQVIVSTAVNEEQEVSFRVRDTAVGMSELELQNALDPFRQLSTSARWGSSGTGLALPITKALAEANHGRFRISSGGESGSLVEVAFPATRVLAT
jgi:PAS domain S-box-containing protein